jgi:hypothetical protein
MIHHAQTMKDMQFPHPEKRWHSTRLRFPIDGAFSGRWVLVLCFSMAMMVSLASISMGGYEQQWRSNPPVSRIDDLPWTGRPLLESSKTRLSTEGDTGYQIWVAPISDGSNGIILSRTEANQETPLTTSSQPSLEAFRRHVMNGKSDQLTGIWVEDVLAFHVQGGLTSRAPAAKDTLSIYNWAWKNGVVGLLIHNYRGGTQLYQLNPGVRIAAIYGNGGVDWYLSRGGTWYESRSPSSGGVAGPFRIWSCEGCAFDI